MAVLPQPGYSFVPSSAAALDETLYSFSGVPHNQIKELMARAMDSSHIQGITKRTPWTCPPQPNEKESMSISCLQFPLDIIPSSYNIILLRSIDGHTARYRLNTHR
jgi:hypothetical protein